MRAAGRCLWHRRSIIIVSLVLQFSEALSSPAINLGSSLCSVSCVGPFHLTDLPHDALSLIASFVPLGERLLRVALVNKKLRDAAYAASIAVCVAEPIDLGYLPHLSTIKIEAPLKTFEWLQRCSRTLTSVEMRCASSTYLARTRQKCAAFLSSPMPSPRWMCHVCPPAWQRLGDTTFAALAAVLPRLPCLDSLRLIGASCFRSQKLICGCSWRVHCPL